MLKYLRRYGIPEEYLFEERDLFEFKNVPKVTRCVAMLGKMVRKANTEKALIFTDFHSVFLQAKVETFQNLSLEIPDEDEVGGNLDSDEET